MKLRGINDNCMVIDNAIVSVLNNVESAQNSNIIVELSSKSTSFIGVIDEFIVQHDTESYRMPE